MNTLPSLKDFRIDCKITEGQYNLDNKALGLSIEIPEALFNEAPFNGTAYSLLQGLRNEIRHYGIIEFPNLPVNKQNYTLAQKHPSEHSYSSNPFLTSLCQSPHQDTPPYPSAFWLNENRQYSATWLMSEVMCQAFYNYRTQNPILSVDEIHQHLVEESLSSNKAILINRQAGLCLVDNSQARQLYHARTSLIELPDRQGKERYDAPMFAFNEIGLMQYIDTIDEQRGQSHRCDKEKQSVLNFMKNERLKN